MIRRYSVFNVLAITPPAAYFGGQSGFEPEPFVPYTMNEYQLHPSQSCLIARQTLLCFRAIGHIGGGGPRRSKKNVSETIKFPPYGGKKSMSIGIYAKRGASVGALAPLSWKTPPPANYSSQSTDAFCPRVALRTDRLAPVFSAQQRDATLNNTTTNIAKCSRKLLYQGIPSPTWGGGGYSPSIPNASVR